MSMFLLPLVPINVGGFWGGIVVTADGARAYMSRDPISLDSQVVMVPLQ